MLANFIFSDFKLNNINLLYNSRQQINFMKIIGNLYVNMCSFQAKKKVESKSSVIEESLSKETAPYSVELLNEIYNVKPKKMNIEESKSKLLRQLNEVLDANRDIDELYSNFMRKMSMGEVHFMKQAEMLALEMDEFMDNPNLNPLEALMKIEEFDKRRKQLKKEAFKKREFVLPEKRDDKIDCALLNAFKTAALEDNFNFEKVYQDYYKDLNNVETVEELTKRYPKIRIPMPAHVVIAKKIEDCLTRDFYQKMESLISIDDNQKLLDFCENQVKEICPKSSKLSDKEYERVVQVAVLNIGYAFEKIFENNSINNIPEIRKNKKVQITDLDARLLNMDYQDFVISVTKQMYFEHKNPSAVRYSDGKNSVSLSELQGTPYKVEKPSEKIKPFIRAGNEIELAKRNYGHFNDEQLHNRLEFFVNKEIANNVNFLEKFVEFSSCDLSTKDKDNFIKFLRILDAITDEKLSEKDALKIIETENIKPIETAKKQEAEKQEILENMRLEQQKAYELNILKSEFDDAINILYMNDMSGLASTCSNYRPDKLDKESIEKANFVIETINSNCSENGVITGKDKVKSLIINRDIFNYYSENEPESIDFKLAIKYAKDYNGNVDIDKAGRYLHNSEIIQNAPQSLEYVADREIVEGIINRAKTQDEQTKYLCKFDEYNNLSDKEKNEINSFIDLFYMDDNVEKYILKQIIETKYVKTDTVSQAKINDNGDTVDVTITSNAKKQILDKYKFPNCLTYMQAFEDGMKMFATDWGSTGIKKTGTNNKALEYKLEIKIMGHDDRLFSKENDYIFDVFSDRGLH